MRLARSLRVLGDLDGAITAFQAAAALRPEDVNPQLGYAGALLAHAARVTEKPPQEFFEAVDAAAARTPEDGGVLYYRGLAARLKGDKAKALRLLTRLRDQLPRGHGARQELDHLVDAMK
jgi:cytochrome c-type biogenesis protein CcmH/NrfG